MTELSIDQISHQEIDKEYFKEFIINDTLEITFLFQSDFNNAKYLRDYLSYILDVFEMNATWKNRFVLIIDELDNNAIEYGTKEGGMNKFVLKIKKENNNLFLNIEVQDEGTGKNSKTAGEMEKIREERLQKGFQAHNSIRGRGLFLIITKLVDELYFLDSVQGGLIVGIHKKIEI